MTRLAFVAAVAVAVFGAACEKSKSGGAGEEAPIQKGSQPKPLPPKAAEPTPPTPPVAEGVNGTPPTGTPPPTAGNLSGADHDEAGYDHGGGGAPGATVAAPPAPAPTGVVGGAALPMDTVRPPAASDLAEYVKGIPGKGTLRAVIETTMGSFHCELYEKQTPITVANFVGLATGKKPWTDPKVNAPMKNTPFFNGIIFHRVIPDFMIQGGDPLGKGIGGPGYNFDDEIVPELRLDQPGLLAMANAGPGTNGSQFFITEVPVDRLTGHHTVFGKCAEVDLVKKIARVPVGANDRPETPVSIKKISILRK